MTDRATISVVPCQFCGTQLKNFTYVGWGCPKCNCDRCPCHGGYTFSCPNRESEANSKADSLAGEAERAQPKNKNLELASYVALRLPKERTSESGFLYDTGDRSELGKIILNLIERFSAERGE